jgi:hypothetical protein
MKLNEQDKERCNQCLAIGSFNDDFGFYKCPDCGNTWAYDEDDPDYLEFEETLKNCIHFHHGHCMNPGTTIEQSCNYCPRY